LRNVSDRAVEKIATRFVFSNVYSTFVPFVR